MLPRLTQGRSFRKPPTTPCAQSSIEESHSPFTTHHSLLKHAPKIFTETCKIDFTKTTDEVHNLIRGLSPFPGAFTELNGKTLKIYRSEKEAFPELRSFPSLSSGISEGGDSGQTETPAVAGQAVRPEEKSGQTGTVRPGEYKTDGKTFLKFACSNGYIYVKELQLEGKKKLQVEEFLRGYRFS